MKDVAIGYDTGFRVCTYLENGGIKGDSGNNMPLINKWLNIAVASERANIKLNNLAQKNLFEICLSNCGEGELNDAVNIEYK
ncbi:hypothetical protein ACL7TT_15175 [Microbulbifer sp. 2304DJ12-6]|uniref:hypothetical protein n=1 Tax=Microbulbifer sp. 2304DJ12-6 TaxID=3233340 RepID=UPI0039AF20F4